MKKVFSVVTLVLMLFSLTISPVFVQMAEARPTPTITVSGKVSVTEGVLKPNLGKMYVTSLCTNGYTNTTKVKTNGNYSVKVVTLPGVSCTHNIKPPLPTECQSVRPPSYTSVYEPGKNVSGRNFDLTCNAQCSDGVDNDGDGKIDFGKGPNNDPGCSGPNDNDENQPPVITLRGDNPMIIRIGNPYVEPEADVDDFEDGDIDHKLVITGHVNTSKVGIYTRYYNAKDSKNAKAKTVKRTVKVIPYDPYCGDGVVNQWWEECDNGGDLRAVGCAITCQYLGTPVCEEHAFMEMETFNVQNEEDPADATTDIYIDGRVIPSSAVEVLMYDGVAVLDLDDIDTYEATPNVGITVQRVATSTVRVRHFGSHEKDKVTKKQPQEHLEGILNPYGTDFVSVQNDTSGNNRMENWGPHMFDQKAINAGKDAAWIDSKTARFWTTVTSADDSFFATWDPIPTCEDPNQPPTAVASSSQTVYVNDTVMLEGTDSSDSDGTIVSYDWDFGDGTTGSSATTSHVYTATGTYTVVLTVEDDDGATDTDTVTIIVQEIPNLPPVADAGPDQTVTTGDTVVFDGTGSSDPDGTIVSYDWDGIGTGATTTHVYATAGTYTVLLEVTDDDGATGTDTVIITVNDPDPEYNLCVEKYYTDSDKFINGWPVAVTFKNNCDQGEEWADRVVEYIPRGDVDSSRRDETQAVGYTDGADDMNFVSLGKGDGGDHGYIILEFDNIIVDGPGGDIEIIEATHGAAGGNCSAYTETADIYASQKADSDFKLLGNVCQDGSVDLDGSGLSWAKYVKIVDTTTDTRSSDGYDVDAVRALHCEAYTTIASGHTDSEEQFCVSGLSPDTEYIVSEEMKDGWENNGATINGVFTSTQSNLVFDVFVTTTLDEGTTIVRFYNNEIVLPECSDGVDNKDPEDTLADADDPGCWSDPNDPQTYDPNDDNETYTPPTPEPYCGDGDCNNGECCDSCPEDCGQCSDPEEPEEPKKSGPSLPIMKIVEIMEATSTDEAVGYFKWRTNMKGSSMVVCDSVPHLDMGQYEDSEGNPLYYGFPYYTVEFDRQFPTDERTIIHEATLDLGLGVDTYYCRVISGDNYTGTPDGHVKKDVIIHVPVKTYPPVVEPQEPEPIIPPGIEEQRCELLLTDWILPVDDSAWEGHVNDPQEFQDLKDFFNYDLKGKYGTFLEGFKAHNYRVGGPLYNAVVKFQQDEAKYVLEPWYLKKGTGNVYISTVNRINEIHCNVEIPFSDEEWEVIKDTREGKKNPYKDKSVQDIPPVVLPEFEQ